MFINLHDTNINYDIFGNENATNNVLLLHGWGTEIATYKSLINMLVDCGCKVYTFDWPGFGSSELIKASWNLDDYVSLAKEFVSEFNIAENLTLVGHSHGGRVIAKLCGTGFVAKRIIILGGAVLVPKKTAKQKFRLYSFKTIKFFLTLPIIRSFTKSALNKARSHYGSADYNAIPEVLRKTFVLLVNTDLIEYLPKIDVPTLLIYGERDTATPVVDAKTMEKMLPNGGLCIINNAGHYSFLDNPVQVNAILHSFIK